MEAILLTLVAFASTTLGGLTAIRHRHRLNKVLGFTAGVILGVIAFDILPEIFSTVSDFHLSSTAPMVALAAGFLSFHIAEKTLLVHHAHEGDYGKHHHPKVGVLSALALSGHSFLDGVGIGLAFQVNTTVGIAVAIAVIAHDFADGLNTVALMLRHKNNIRKSLKLLAVDAFAPILGAASTLLFTLSPSGLVIYLGFFAGFLLYIGASDILPQAHSEKSSLATIGLTILGTAMIFGVTRLI